MNRNVLIVQSGGPSPVINASLQGVIEACLAYPDSFGRIYAGFHGVEGVLCEQLLDGSRYFGAVRLALGLEIAWLAVSLLDQVRHVLN